MKTKPIWRFLPPITLTAILFAGAIRAAEAPPAIQWDKSFGGDKDDYLGTDREAPISAPRFYRALLSP